MLLQPSQQHGATPTRYRTLIAGEWCAGDDDRWLEDRNPADREDLLGLTPALGQVDAMRGVEAASAAAPAWRATSAVDRGRVLLAAASIIRREHSKIAGAITREMGKTLGEATAEVGAAADMLEFYGGVGRMPQGVVLPDARSGVRVTAEREPVGVVLAITPWNDPLLTPARKLGPALVSGNTVALKPSQETPVVALYLASSLHEAGLPPGVLNVVTGRASDLAPTLTSHPAVAAITFTGSTAVGMSLRAATARRNVRVQTEMGGKNASVVLPDADFERAAETICAAAFGQGGQRCTATSRVIVQREVKTVLLELMLSKATSLRVGPGDADDSDMGPVASAQQLETIVSMINDARKAGATALCGGTQLTEPPLDRGYFVAPTIFDSVTPDMALWREEVFGPVVAVVTVGSLDEAIAAANESDFGLSAAVFTRSLDAAQRFADLVEAGQVAVNLPTSGWAPQVPFGGFGMSGSAFKEQGLNALDFYTRTKTVAVSAG